MTTKPLTRPSTRLCPGCKHRRTHGHFSESVVLDKDPQRWRRVAHEVCRACRAGSRSAPGRAMQ